MLYYKSTPNLKNLKVKCLKVKVKALYHFHDTITAIATNTGIPDPIHIPPPPSEKSNEMVFLKYFYPIYDNSSITDWIDAFKLSYDHVPTSLMNTILKLIPNEKITIDFRSFSWRCKVDPDYFQSKFLTIVKMTF